MLPARSVANLQVVNAGTVLPLPGHSPGRVQIRR